jgi:hypothetical protein
MIGRREFITLLGSAAARPIAARAQYSGKTCTSVSLILAGRRRYQ